MPSVTDLAKAMSGPQEGLIEWANRVGLEGKTLAEARTPRRDDGNRLHDELQRLVEGRPLADAADDAVVLMAEWWSSVGAVEAWAERSVRAVFGFDPEQVEVWGRSDVLARVADGRYVVFDAKVGRKPYVGADNLIQVGLYQAAWRMRLVASGDPGDVDGAVVRVSPDGALRLVPSPWSAAQAVDMAHTLAALWARQEEARSAAAGYFRR